MADQVITAEELARHNKTGDLWLAVGEYVYDVSNFAEMHPGGEKLIEQYSGMDATDDFYSLHRKDVLIKYKRLRIGKLANATAVADESTAAVPFVDPPAFTGNNSPYYNETHFRFQKATRAFVQEHLAVQAASDDLAGIGADKVRECGLQGRGKHCMRPYCVMNVMLGA